MCHVLIKNNVYLCQQSQNIYIFFQFHLSFVFLLNKFRQIRSDPIVSKICYLRSGLSDPSPPACGYETIKDVIYQKKLKFQTEKKKV